MEMEKQIGLKYDKKRYNELERKKMFEQIATQTAFQTASQALLKGVDALLKTGQGDKQGQGQGQAPQPQGAPVVEGGQTLGTGPRRDALGNPLSGPMTQVNSRTSGGQTTYSIGQAVNYNGRDELTVLQTYPDGSFTVEAAGSQEVFAMRAGPNGPIAAAHDSQAATEHPGALNPDTGGRADDPPPAGTPSR